MIDLLISVCSKHDLKTWETSHKYIEENIEAIRYVVCVPSSDLYLFRSLNMKKFEIVDENLVIGNLKQIIQNYLPDIYKNKAGWYLQQFIKLKIAYEFVPKTGIILIWDADTIPLKKLNFIDHLTNKLVYYKSDEYHSEYFVTMEKLNISKFTNFSFISQCIVFKTEWLCEIIKNIENTHDCYWVDAILKSIDFNKKDAFSEYETIGNHIYNNHRNEMLFLDSNLWNRFGRRMLKNKLKKFPLLSHDKYNFDYIAYEKWDKKIWKDFIPNFILTLLIKLKRFSLKILIKCY